MPQNFKKMLHARAQNIASAYGLKLEIREGSRVNGLAWIAEFQNASAYGYVWQEFRAGSARELFYEVAAFGDGLRFLSREF